MSDRILYVDDDAANLTVMKAACAGEFDIVTVSDGAAALDLIGTQKIAVVLADQRMPGMTGVDVLERVRQESPATIRVLVTAYSDIHEAAAAINRAHVHRYLRKPWQPEELRALLRDALEVFHTHQRLHELERRFMETERVYALGVVAASIAHEVRSPLTALIGHLDVARQRLDRLIDLERTGGMGLEDHLVAYNGLALNLTRAVETTENVIQITRGVELGARHDDASRTADLCDLVETTLLMVKADLTRKTRLLKDLRTVPPVRGSRTAIGQIVLNLIVNALQALPDDRPRAENVIEITLLYNDEHVQLVVADNGPGVPEAVRNTIFEPFFTTKHDGGTGLGLAISKRIVEQLGGSISITSSDRGGARFTVNLVPITTNRPRA